jgi:hypothetical protein
LQGNDGERDIPQLHLFAADALTLVDRAGGGRHVKLARFLTDR